MSLRINGGIIAKQILNPKDCPIRLAPAEKEEIEPQSRNNPRRFQNTMRADFTITTKIDRNMFS